MTISALAIDLRVFACIMVSMVWPIRPNSDPLTARVSPMKPTLMAMTVPAPMARTTSAGTLFIAPPSTSTMPSRSTGGKMPGSDMVARIALASTPLSRTICCAVTRSTAIARNGVGKSSKLERPTYGPAIRASRKSTCCPLFKASGSANPRLIPNSMRDG